MTSYVCGVAPISTLKNGWKSETLEKSNLCEIAVIDLSRFDLFDSLENVQKFLSTIRSMAQKVVLIDALGIEAFSKKALDLPIDMLVMPYVGADIDCNSKWEILQGSDYAILSSDYFNLPTRTIQKIANRILISCGGSDPKNFSIAVLEAIELIPEFLEVRIVIGPLFHENLFQELMIASSRSRHKISLIKSPNSLADHMIWSDIAIATTGLIKYELAATGTPAMLMSIDRTHELVNEPFSKIGSSVDIDINLSPRDIADRVLALMIDYNARVIMSDLGREKIDGLGASRLMNKILKKVPNE
jgi:spore coat polysaccharide biosynthesis predicted glycosyltransferase SpsG